VDFFQDKNYLFTFENRDEFNILYKENFIEEIYKPRIKLNPKLIIDIGGHIGLTTLYLKKLYPKAVIKVYEPNPISFQLLQDNISINGISDVELNQVAVTNSFSTRDFFIDNDNSWYSTSSLSEKGWNGTQKLDKISIETISFESILDLKPDFIKMDIEGAEQSLIKSNLEKLANTSYLAIEFHRSEQQNFKRMLKLLAQAGFITTVVEDKLDKGLSMIYAQRK
jgi:FkbM family methyltransferase